MAYINLVSGLLPLGLILSVTIQCPDGSPPPCARVPVDSNVIVILPFRLRTDSALGYLRAGLAEVLPVEFTGVGVPRAVDPDIVLRAWQRAGRGQDLERGAALRLAEQLGAGRLLLGAIVGTSMRITLTASIIGVPDGATRVGVVQLQGSPDSLPAIVAGLMMRLSAGSASITRLTSNDPGTTSPQAWREYMAGISSWRLGRTGVPHYARALELDSSFVLAAYWLAMSRALATVVERADSIRASRIAWRERHRLTTDQRTLLEAVFGPGGPDSSYSDGVYLALLERAAVALPRSFEAWHILADRYFHVGGLLGRAEWRSRSRAAFERALRLDEGATPNPVSHLATLAFIDGDRQAHRRHVQTLISRFPNSVATVWERYAAAIVDQLPTLAGDRRRFVERGANGGFPWLVGATIPARERELLLRDLEATITDAPGRRRLLALRLSNAANSGQLRRAAELRSAYFGIDSAASDFDQLRWAERDSAAAERLARVLTQEPEASRWLWRCEVALARLRRDDTTSAAIDVRVLRAVPQRGGSYCAELIDAIAQSKRAGGDMSLLHRMDTILIDLPQPVSRFWNYDLALAYAKRRQWLYAASAARRRLFALFGGPEGHRMAISLRDEGRWSLLAGDTTAAIAAFRHYLRWREMPEPDLISERDSLRAELARLERGRR